MRALSSSKTVTAVPCAMRSCEIALCGGVRRGDAMIARGARPRDLACVSVRSVVVALRWTRDCACRIRIAPTRVAGVYRRLENAQAHLTGPLQPPGPSTAPGPPPALRSTPAARAKSQEPRTA